MRKSIVTNLTELVGDTPLLSPTQYIRSNEVLANLLFKLEAFNPTGSIKDRAALALIESAEQKGVLKEGSTLIESTSGNTGIGLAFVAASRGYKLILTMPDTMSVERQNLLKALGAQLVLTPGAQGMKGAIQKADQLEAEIEGSVRLHQFSDPANPDTHAKTTAAEIWNATHGKVDMVVAGVGTGGTVSGLGKGLKMLNPSIQIVAVEPQDSPIISQGVAGPHKIQGIGAGFVPENYHADVVDTVMTVAFDDAVRASRHLAQKEGLLVGISSGAAAHVATELAKLPENANKTIIAILPDTGERYLSTLLYAYDDYPLE